MSTQSQTFPIILSLVAAVAGAFAQYFYKVGSSYVLEVSIYKNWHIIFGLISFTAVLVLFIFAFRIGGRMFVIYPIYATTYIWGGLIAYYIDKEPINLWQIVGVAFIMVGVSVISLGYSR